MPQWALISDTHGTLPDVSLLKGAAVVLHAGDIGPDLDVVNWRRGVFQPWLEQLVAQDSEFYGTYGNHDRPGNWKDYSHSPIDNHRAQIVVDALRGIKGKKVWFSPWSPTFGNWAWMSAERLLAEKYKRIPNDVDIIVSHSPMWGDCGGMTERGEDAGSIALRLRCEHLLPDHLVCGHIHEGFGQRILVGHSGLTTKIYNCSLMDLAYQPVNPITWIEV